MSDVESNDESENEFEEFFKEEDVRPVDENELKEWLKNQKKNQHKKENDPDNDDVIIDENAFRLCKKRIRMQAMHEKQMNKFKSLLKKPKIDYKYVDKLARDQGLGTKEKLTIPGLNVHKKKKKKNKSNRFEEEEEEEQGYERESENEDNTEIKKRRLKEICEWITGVRKSEVEDVSDDMTFVRHIENIGLNKVIQILTDPEVIELHSRACNAGFYRDGIQIERLCISPRRRKTKNIVGIADHARLIVHYEDSSKKTSAKQTRFIDSVAKSVAAGKTEKVDVVFSRFPLSFNLHSVVENTFNTFKKHYYSKQKDYPVEINICAVTGWGQPNIKQDNSDYYRFLMFKCVPSSKTYHSFSFKTKRLMTTDTAARLVTKTIRKAQQMKRAEKNVLLYHLGLED